jgi:hypothetical protein
MLTMRARVSARWEGEREAPRAEAGWVVAGLVWFPGRPSGWPFSFFFVLKLFLISVL